MTKEQSLNLLIINGGFDTDKISDGFHTFEELYAHRIELFITLCKSLMTIQDLTPPNPSRPKIWKSKNHSDGTSHEGWFIMGIGITQGRQITYHLPMSKWEQTSFVLELDKAPEWDGHNSHEALQRLKTI